MNKLDWKNSHRAARREARKIAKLQAWRNWAQGMRLVRELDNLPELMETRQRDAMIERIGSVGGADIGRLAYQ